VLTDKELEVASANLRAWNHWGRIWRLERKHGPLDPSTLRLMKTRTLIYRKMYIEMISYFGGLKDKTILDVGCGTSEYLKWLADDSERLVGVDISVEMLKLCREDMRKSIVVIVADALHLPFRDGVFDIGTTFQSLHHFPDWKKALTEMVRTAEQVSLYEPNEDSVFHKLMHYFRKIFRVEKRFKQTDEDYGLVEFQASGFSSTRIIPFLNKRGINAKVLVFGYIPVSLLAKISKLSPRLLYFAVAVEDLIRKIPILRDQLGNILVIGWKTNCR